MINLSIVILTYNEEINLDRCLKNIQGLNSEVFVVDSFSNDRTLEIAQEYNCNILQNSFINHARQLNWALENIHFKTDWVLRLDADEYLTDELIEEIKLKLSSIDINVSGVFLKRRVYFLQKWIRFGGYYPTKLLRIWRVSQGICEERWMDEHIKLHHGNVVNFDYDIIDDNLKNLHWWIEKHNNYATKEAIEHLNYKYKLMNSDYLKSNFFGTQDQRKRWFKENWYSCFPLIIRSFIYFLYRYILRFGFLDGFRGLLFHFLQGFWYRFLVDAKVYEIEKKSKTENISIKEVIKKEYKIKI